MDKKRIVRLANEEIDKVMQAATAYFNTLLDDDEDVERIEYAMLRRRLEEAGRDSVARPFPVRTDDGEVIDGAIIVTEAVEAFLFETLRDEGIHVDWEMRNLLKACVGAMLQTGYLMGYCVAEALRAASMTPSAN